MKRIYNSPQTEVTLLAVINNIMITSIGGSDGSGLPSGPSAPGRWKEPVRRTPVF